MHTCNAYCFEDEHLDMCYTNIKDVDLEEIIQSVNTIWGKDVQVKNVRETYEFDREIGVKRLSDFGLSADTGEYVGFTQEYNNEIRAFRVVFSFRNY